MTISLRPRQAKAIEDLRAAYRAGYRSPILYAPTGFGKSATATVMIRSALDRGRSVWFLAHLRELLIDASAKLTQADIPHGWIAAGVDGDRRQRVQVAMIQTLVRRLDRHTPPDLLIVDEAHLAVAKSYQDVFAWASSAHRLLLTATPIRLDGRGMGEVADTIIPTCSTGDLIAEGLLSPIRYFAPSKPDLSGVRSTGGDYAAGALAAAMDKPTITGDVVSHWLRIARGRPTIVFCVSIAHAESVAEAFRQAGVRAAAVSGDTDTAVRDAALTDLQAGRLDVVCNCALWVAGVDAPCVSCIVLLAPTQSLTKYLQSVGRGLRTHPGKTDCVILDHAGNLDRHGSPTLARDWSLSGVQKRPGTGEAVAVRTCPRCFAANPGGARVCQSCGHEFVVQGREVETVDGELAEVDAAAAKRAARVEQGRAKTEAELIALAKARGIRRAELWARHVLRGRAERDRVLAAGRARPV